MAEYVENGFLKDNGDVEISLDWIRLIRSEAGGSRFHRDEMEVAVELVIFLAGREEGFHFLVRQSKVHEPHGPAKLAYNFEILFYGGFQFHGARRQN
ncbi:MAG: hypothetical protein A3H27_13215 [Acidobacteria bacterium RIFCSPLOWO2_02_FULL_59_13]|nr:MAG: hypothetical protein A3H27_13215 [Acidobacteria bacterium RIFCSPLOWO2_02_FULL_59_13]